MLFFGEEKVFNSPANTHSSQPSQLHFLGITCLWPTFKLYNKCSAFSSASYCSNPYHSATICGLQESRGKSHLAAGLFRKARCFPGGWSHTHPPTPTVPAFRDGSLWGSALLSRFHTKHFLKHLKPSCQGFHPFQFPWYRLLQGTFLWFLPGSFPGGKDSGGFVPFVFAKRLHSCWHYHGVTGGSTGRRPWPLHPGYSYMALGIEQPRKDKFTWLSLGDPANTFFTDDWVLISNTAQPKGRGCFDSLTMVVIN